MPQPSQILFLPGASGNTQFWRPLADLITHSAEFKFVGYPGFGSVPADATVQNFEDLVESVVRQIDRPTAIVAQSMGGVIAIRAALERPNLVTHLVLAATSGGVDTKRFGAQDWRDSYTKDFPQVPDWFTTNQCDLTPEIGGIQAPTLLLWGDADPISPVAIGEHLLGLLPNVRLHVVHGGEHDLGYVFAADLEPLVNAHLG